MIDESWSYKCIEIYCGNCQLNHLILLGGDGGQGGYSQERNAYEGRQRVKSQHAWGTARPYKLGEEIHILSWRQGAWGTSDILERICYLQCREWAGRSKTEDRRQFGAYYRPSMKRDWKKEMAVSTRRRWHQDEGNLQGLCHPCDEEKEDGWRHPHPRFWLGRRAESRWHSLRWKGLGEGYEGRSWWAQVWMKGLQGSPSGDLQKV